MAITITWTDVVAMAPELSTVPLASQTAVLAAVALQMDVDLWDAKLNLGAVYLAAHLATIRGRNGVGGPVVAESAGSVSRAYSASVAAGAAQLGSTSYGIEYERLILTLACARVALCD